MRISAFPSLRKTVSIVRSALNSLADADSDAADADSHVLRCSKFAKTCDKQNKERRVCAKVCGGWSTTCGDQRMHLLSVICTTAMSCWLRLGMRQGMRQQTLRSIIKRHFHLGIQKAKINININIFVQMCLMSMQWGAAKLLVYASLGMHRACSDQPTQGIQK